MDAEACEQRAANLAALAPPVFDPRGTFCSMGRFAASPQAFGWGRPVRIATSVSDVVKKKQIVEYSMEPLDQNEREIS